MTAAVTAGPTDRNRSAQAWATVARSTGPSSSRGGWESNRASQSMSSTSRRSRSLSALDPDQRVTVIGRLTRAGQGQVGLGPDHAQRGAQLVRGIRGELQLAAPGLLHRGLGSQPDQQRAGEHGQQQTGPAVTSPISSKRSVRWSPARLRPTTSQSAPFLASFRRNGARLAQGRGDRLPVPGAGDQVGRQRRGARGARDHAARLRLPASRRPVRRQRRRRHRRPTRYRDGSPAGKLGRMRAAGRPAGHRAGRRACAARWAETTRFSTATQATYTTAMAAVVTAATLAA